MLLRNKKEINKKLRDMAQELKRIKMFIKNGNMGGATAAAHQLANESNEFASWIY